MEFLKIFFPNVGRFLALMRLFLKKLSTLEFIFLKCQILGKILTSLDFMKCQIYFISVFWKK
jgi:hypothetical protein